MTTSNQRESAHPVDTLFLDRWSPRAFSGEPLPQDQLMTLLEAARWAPSASNHQPWRFVYGVKGTEAFERLLALLVPGNQRWAKQAGALVFIFSQTHLGTPGAEDHRPIPTHSLDAGAAWMSFALQAQLIGLHAHGMAGIDHPAVPGALEVPDGFRLELAIAVGTPGRLEDLPEDLQGREKPSTRKPLADLASEGRFPG